MKAMVSQFLKGALRSLPSGTTTVATIVITPGSYVVFAKLDLVAAQNADDPTHVQVALRFSHSGQRIEDETTHQWAHPRSSNHRTETIALNIGVQFELLLTDPNPPERRPVEVVALTPVADTVSVSNIIVTVIEVDQVEHSQS
jgi:hypothetical protein